MALHYSYQVVHCADGRQVHAPMILVKLQGRRSVNTLALIDSGAERCVVPGSLAKDMGLVEMKPSSALGIGGTVPSFESEMEVTLSKVDESLSVIVPVTVVQDQEDFPVLLGREAFFDCFAITFDQSNDLITLDANPG